MTQTYTYFQKKKRKKRVKTHVAYQNDDDGLSTTKTNSKLNDKVMNIRKQVYKVKFYINMYIYFISICWIVSRVCLFARKQEVAAMALLFKKSKKRIVRQIEYSMYEKNKESPVSSSLLAPFSSFVLFSFFKWNSPNWKLFKAQVYTMSKRKKEIQKNCLSWTTSVGWFFVLEWFIRWRERKREREKLLVTWCSTYSYSTNTIGSGVLAVEAQELFWSFFYSTVFSLMPIPFLSVFFLFPLFLFLIMQYELKMFLLTCSSSWSSRKSYWGTLLTCPSFKQLNNVQVWSSILIFFFSAYRYILK